MLQVKDVKAHDFLNRLAIGFVVGPNLSISPYSFRFNPIKNRLSQVYQLLWDVFALMPRISGERVRVIWSRNNGFSTRLQHSVDFLEEKTVFVDVFDHLETHNGIVSIVRNPFKGRDYSLLESYARIFLLQSLNYFTDFIQTQVLICMWKQFLHTSSFSTADLKQISRDPGFGSNISFEQSLMNGIVTDQLI